MKLATLIKKAERNYGDQRKGGRPKTQWTKKELKVIQSLAEAIADGTVSKNVLLKTIREERSEGLNVDGIGNDKSIYAIENAIIEYLRG